MQRPWISINLAISADGKITSSARQASGWTSDIDHERLLQLRQPADALLVGMGTLIADRMTLTCPGKEIHPLRCVISRKRHISADHPIFQRDGGPIHLVLTDSDPAQTDNDESITLHKISLTEFLELLSKKYQVKHLHCEGGGELVRSLAELDAIDEFHATLAGHKIFGGEDAPTATGTLGNYLPHSIHFELTHCEPRQELGECFLTYRRKPSVNTQ